MLPCRDADAYGWLRRRNLASLLVFALLAMAAGTPLSATPAPDATAAAIGEDDQVARATQLLDDWSGDGANLEGAKSRLDAVLSVNPASATAHRQYARYHIMRAYKSGSTYDAAGLAEAERWLDQAVALAPRYAEAFVLRGHLYRLQQRPAEAKAALRTAETLGTHDPWLDLNWADLLVDEGRHDEALAKCRIVIARAPKDLRVLAWADDCLIDGYRKAGKLDEADAAYRANIARNPGRAWSHGNHAGFLLCTRDQPEAAAQAAAKALALMDYGMARGVLAAALYRSWTLHVLAGRSDEAAKAWQVARAVSDGDPAEVMEGTCGRKSVLPVLRALRDSRHGQLIAPMFAVLLAAEAAPDLAPGIYGFEVMATGRERGHIFLNSEQDYRDQRNLTVRFSPQAAAAFRKLHGADADIALKGKRINVVGGAQRVKVDFTSAGVATGKFYYQTHVLVTEAWQVEVEVPGATPPPAPDAAPGLRT